MFRVVTHRAWLAEAFAAVGGVQDFGFDVDPESCGTDTWWASGAWIAGAARAGADIPVLSAGPWWITEVPEAYRGRRVFVGSPASAERAAERWGCPRVWAKLPEAKSDDFPASLVDVAAVSTDFRFHATPVIQVSEPLAGVHAEARFFCSPGAVSGGSFYLLDEHSWGSDEFGRSLRDGSEGLRALLSEMRSLAEGVYRVTPGPPGYVIDVAALSDGAMAVMEANAAWSSNPYDTDPAEAFAAVEAAHDRTGELARWRFDPVQVPSPWPRVRVVGA